jgi:hypothetical protein
MFFIRKSKLIVDVFTTRREIAEYFPIANAIEHAPSWWKNADKSYTENSIKRPTLKTCDGLTTYLSTGFILPLWSDLALNIEEKSYHWQFSDERTDAKVHSPKQWEMFKDTNKLGHLKIISPYRLKDKNKLNWLLLNPPWRQSNTEWFEAPQGILEFKNRHELNINLLFDLQNKGARLIEANTPLIHLIPLTEKKVILKHHVVDEKEFNSMDIENIAFNGAYRKKLSMQKNKSKCPFHFK